MKKIIPQSIKNIYHLFQSILANLWFGFPSRNMVVIGVTGTNGKTTVCQMVTGILEEAGNPVKPDGHGASKVAMASTINFKIGEREWVNKTKFTTLSSWSIQKFIAEAVSKGCKYLVLETSSHSLDQFRVWGVEYRTAVITNITREHLDYHETMEAYRQAKINLFKRAEVAIINLDMEGPDDFLNRGAKIVYGYTTKNQNVKIKMQDDNVKIKIILAENIKINNNGSQFSILKSQFSINLPGEFNVENALAAIAVGQSENIPDEKIKTALEKIKNVPGRLEYIPNKRGFNIIVDYAVTPDSLSKLYALIQQINTKKTKIISVMGACGERDCGKRPLMGEIVDANADHIILTDEDPYNEDPERIIAEIKNGIKNKILGQNLFVMNNRRQAIKKALDLAGPGDYIIVTGKGAEETMAIGRKRIPWNDKKVIQELLSELE